ncbi:hypothetical protein [Aureivirga marina]|uniref:hypothetical protein n=1 Tax=Aureivirga marina TaxID=1182451 RepID=UPI0018CB8ACF|nr:hypothetical protein [Aureivirga marina]
MNFNYNNFKDKFYKKYSNHLPIDEIDKLLGEKEDYEYDSSTSSGKRLKIDTIHLYGLKINTLKEQNIDNTEINFTHEYNNGINIFIADNLRGKSSVLKFIKFALTGSNSSLKADVKKWVNQVFLNFRINEKKYTIFLDLSKKSLRAKLFFGTAKNLKEFEDYNQKEIFIIDSTSVSDYTNKIENFFFKEFSYYSLNWTQKNSNKDQTGLKESRASWKTYFKSIFLESKDSSELVYGNQPNKMFQNLLGLDFTYPINQLSLKRDFMKSNRAELNNAIFKNKMNVERKKEEIRKNLDILNNRLQEIDNLLESDINLNDLLVKKKILLKEYEEVSSLKNQKINLNNKLRSIRNTKDSLIIDKDEYQTKLNKTKKSIADLKEYNEYNVFFANLDIVKCPKCEKEITEEKKKEALEKECCSLCNESIDKTPINILERKESYESKIKRLEENLISDQKRIDEALNEIDKNDLNYNNVYNEIILIEGKIRKILPIDKIVLKINEIIQSEKKLIQLENGTIRKEKDSLLEKKGELNNKLNNLANNDVNIEEENYDIKISLLEDAIIKLTDLRYEKSSKILTELSGLMLQELKMFGLNSISEIKIDKKLNINFIQSDEIIQFSNIAEGEQLRVKLAFYLSLIQLDIQYNFGKHVKFLVIDSPSKEEGDSSYLTGLINKLKDINDKHGDELQILIGTAERSFEGVVKNEKIFPENEFVF